MADIQKRIFTYDEVLELLTQMKSDTLDKVDPNTSRRLILLKEEVKPFVEDFVKKCDSTAIDKFKEMFKKHFPDLELPEDSIILLHLQKYYHLSEDIQVSYLADDIMYKNTQQ